MVAASIQELTKELYKELSYNSASKVIKGNFMKDICTSTLISILTKLLIVVDKALTCLENK